MSTSVLLLLFGILICLVVAFQNPRYIQNPSLQLLRALFPSWKFFDGREEELVLSVREQGSSSWRQLLQQPQFSFSQIFFAPQRGLFLAQGSLCEEFWNAWEDVQEDVNATRCFFEASPLARLLASLIVYETKKQGISEISNLACCFHIRGVGSPVRQSAVFHVVYQEGQDAQLVCP